ncbi:hypothetical protein [Moorena sp. SIO3E8]|uniref:hypothetical protein n=1 Tax=Moorena sp. SIO3E8 TaxID=2607830 RepID=UPI0025D5110F|nr:hypothetical protein [Moorena sp. SIO3E8]
MQRGLGEAARSWGGSAAKGGFPHERLPWSPPSATAVVPPISALHQDNSSAFV